jgi:PIN domain nuclease of toxin-antitoxin system
MVRKLIDASSLDIALCHHQYRQNYLNVIRGRMVISSVDLTYLTGKFPALLE